jgi:hypothetical protein
VKACILVVVVLLYPPEAVGISVSNPVYTDAEIPVFETPIPIPVFAGITGIFDHQEVLYLSQNVIFLSQNVIFLSQIMLKD